MAYLILKYGTTDTFSFFWKLTSMQNIFKLSKDDPKKLLHKGNIELRKSLLKSL